MKGKTSFHDDDEAVSPVIGVILMVAITVILAAVIGTFVLGLGQDVQTNIQAGATIDCDADGDQIKVTWTTNQNADKLEVEFSHNNNANSETLGSVGQSYTASSSTLIAGNEVDVTVVGVSGEQRDVVQTDSCDLA